MPKATRPASVTLVRTWLIEAPLYMHFPGSSSAWWIWLKYNVFKKKNNKKEKNNLPQILTTMYYNNVIYSHIWYCFHDYTFAFDMRFDITASLYVLIIMKKLLSTVFFFFFFWLNLLYVKQVIKKQPFWFFFFFNVGIQSVGISTGFIVLRKRLTQAGFHTPLQKDDPSKIILLQWNSSEMCFKGVSAIF